MRVILILVSILAACTFPPIGGNKTETPEIPDAANPKSVPVDVTVPKPATPRKAAPKPADKPAEPELINPLADCMNVEIADPKEAARARLDCMSEQLKITPTEQK